MAIPDNYIDKITKGNDSRMISPAADMVRVNNDNFDGETLDDVLNEIVEEMENAGDGTVTGVKVGDTTYDPTEGVVDLSTPFANKVDKVTGKGLSTNDFTTAEKTKLAGIDPSTYATKTEVNAKQDTINDLDAIRSGAALGATALQSYTETDPTVPAWAKQSTKPSYTASEVGAVPTTRTVNGKALNNNITLSASDVGADVFVVNIESDGNDGYTCDKTNAEIYAAWQAGRNIVLISLGECLYKLNALPSQTFCEFGGEQYDDIGGYRYYSIFTNNGQQKVVKTYIYFQEQLASGTNIKTINNQSLLGSGNLTASDIGALPSSTHIPADQVQSNWNETNTSSKAYIQNKPTIPAAQVNSDWAATSGVAQILNKPSFKTINGESIVGTGDIEVGSDDVATAFTITITSTTIEVQPMTGAMMTVGTDVSFQVV